MSFLKGTVFWEQQEGQPFEQYVTELRTKAEWWSFAETENMVRDHNIVFAMWDLHLKERLLREKELHLTQAVEASRA